MINSLSKVDKFKKEKIIYKNLIKYNQTQEKLCQYKIKNLMFHKKSHYTSIFIEYLIYDDNQEFLFELFPLNYCIPNMVSSINMQCHKFFIPMIINECSRNLIKINISMKKILMKNKSLDSEETRYIFKKKYSNILPSDISDYSLNEKEDMIDSFKTYRKFTNINKNQILNTNTSRKNTMNNINKNENDSQNKAKTQDGDKTLPIKGKECNESESTIDNVNANNDISISLDLKINQIYDDKLLTQNMEFVKGKNEKNDKELLKMLNYLKPISTAYIYRNNQNSKNKTKSNNIYLDYVHNKKNRLTETSSKNKSEKKKNLNVNKEHLKNLINLNNNINKYALHSNTNSQNNKIKNILIKERYNMIEKNSNKTNNKINSNSKTKVNSNSKHHHNNINIKLNNITNNYNILNEYNKLKIKATSPKVNTSHKNKSENHNQEIKIDKNKKYENAFVISQQNLGVNSNSKNNNEQKNGCDKDKKKKYNQKEIKSNVPTDLSDESKLGKIKNKKNSEDNSIQTIAVPQKFISYSRDKKNECIKNNNINSINNVNIIGEGEIKVFKRNNNNKLLDISDARKIKLYTSIRDYNNINKVYGRKKYIKKEKSLDCKLSNTNVNSTNKSGANQSSNKKNITSVKRKTSDGINIFH